MVSDVGKKTINVISDSGKLKFSNYYYQKPNTLDPSCDADTRLRLSKVVKNFEDPRQPRLQYPTKEEQRRHPQVHQ